MQWTLRELSNWEELRPYVDTALLPLYLYKQELPLPEHVLRMTYLMNVAAAIEQRLKGRVLLYPIAYLAEEGNDAYLLPGSFPHYIVLQFSGQALRAAADTSESTVHYLTIGDEDLDSALRFEVTVDILYQEVLKVWRSV